MQIILDTYGLNLSVRNKCFLISKKEEKRMIHPARVSNFLITMPCSISTPAILLAVTNGIAINICSRSGMPEAKLWSPGFANTAALRRKQYGFIATEQACQWSKHIISLKLEKQASNLAFLANRKPGLKDETDKAITFIKGQAYKATELLPSDPKWVKILRYLEASGANQYWQLLGVKLPPPYFFEHRIKKQAPDTFNSAINYLYGMLRNHVETAVLSFGLDPSLGVMHVDGYKRPSLVFDLMEPFRPVMDKLLLEQILLNKLGNISSNDEFGICWLNKNGRRTIINLFNQKLNSPMVFNKQKTALKNHILTQTKFLTNQIKAYDS